MLVASSPSPWIRRSVLDQSSSRRGVHAPVGVAQAGGGVCDGLGRTLNEAHVFVEEDELLEEEVVEDVVVEDDVVEVVLSVVEVVDEVEEEEEGDEDEDVVVVAVRVESDFVVEDP